MGGTDVGELVVGEGEVENRDEEEEGLAPGLLVDGAEGLHLCLVVEGEPRRRWQLRDVVLVVNLERTPILRYAKSMAAEESQRQHLPA